ncbi:bifunctional glutamate N-acetyltransferase/amino-acid acetyltransferase ArgJ [Sulfobacillus sp. hq2]|uniref:bifunctional glutamate N-acetyltransferase/amino-acid acetyltransferase ArgJ n=1 Tax=Sulfobacillus TaxID=28033 RepID=UPI001FA82C83|nr:bifunctional glutamate N-acetyltransferase/amino-acid acetyltransferase ArgJ [Sulfobacillus sp. hq2]
MQQFIEPPLSGMMWQDATVTYPQGFQAYAAAAGLIAGRHDMACLWSVVPAVFSGLFTTNQAAAAPITVTKQVAAKGWCQAIIINAGNANAVTGQGGLQDAYTMQQYMADHLGVASEQVAVASTGVIGVPLPMDQVQQGMSQLVDAWQQQHSDGVKASEAILTTDREPKTLACDVTLSSGVVRIGMMAKGSGMIHPQMATMLAFFTTDAAIEKSILDELMRQAVSRSFLRVSVDGDPSTNDMAVILANGQSGVHVGTPEDIAQFGKALAHLARQGARMIAHDGEGATRLITVRVRGAATEEDAALKARTAVRSNLVKAAVYGGDPNWGRVIASVGSVGLPFDLSAVSLWIGTVLVLEGGLPVPMAEDQAHNELEADEVVMDVLIGNGPGFAEAWGCDLTEQYVEINAHYRT